MTESVWAPNVGLIERDEVTHEGLRAVLECAEQTKSPPVSWYLTMGHNPEVATAFASVVSCK